MSEQRKVILVGHCGPDMHMLRSAISRAVPHVDVTHANDERTLNDRLTNGWQNALLLINRALDGDFSFDTGVGLIQWLGHRQPPPAMMLVSNYSDAQDHAVHAGAIRGFGKLQLYNESTVSLLRESIPTTPKVSESQLQ